MKIAVFSSRPYDREFLHPAAQQRELECHFVEAPLTEQTARLAEGFDVVCVFVNDDVNASVVSTLAELGVRMVALRCAGFNNVDIAPLTAELHLADTLDEAIEFQQRIGPLARALVAAGVPQVVFDVGDVHAMLGQGQGQGGQAAAGTIVPVLDTDAMAGAVQALLADPEAYRRQTGAARDRVAANYALEICADKHLALYAECMGEKLGKPPAPS